MGSALRRIPVGTTPESSVSVVASLDTCGHAAHSRTYPYRSDLRVGNSSPIIVNNGMEIINRETPHRPGPHPHRSTLTLFESHAIHHASNQIHPTHRQILQSIQFNYNLVHVQKQCLSTADHDHERLQEVPAKDVTERTPAPQVAHRNTSSDSRQHRTGEAPRRPVCELVAFSG